MRLSEFDALSFDCYGTLIDWEAGIAGILGPWAKTQGLDMDNEALLAGYAVQEAEVEAEAPFVLYPEVLARSFGRLAERLGVSASAEYRQRLSKSVPDWPAFADSASSLSSLSESYLLLVLSNVDRDSFRASNERLGVRFAKIVTAQDVGSYKPAARNFEALVEAASEIGIRPGKLLHVAQSLFHDHVPAQAAGLPTVWIDRRRGRQGWGATPAPGSAVAPDWEFNSMVAFVQACRADAEGR